MSEVQTARGEELTTEGVDTLPSSAPKLYLIIYNIGKKANVKELLLSAIAFGVYEVLVVGQRKLEHSLLDLLSQLQHKFIGNLEECRAYLKEKGVSITGVEIMDEAKNIHDLPFTGDTAIMMGNEGAGLSSRQVRACDYFLYIPQYGGGTASLNVTVAASIIMHCFASWAGYEELSLPLPEAAEEARSERSFSGGEDGE